MPRLTTKFCTAAAVPSKTADDLPLPGGGRLVFVVKPTGTRAFVLRDRSGGGDRIVTLGRFPEIGLAEARERALAIAAGDRPDPRKAAGTLGQLLDAYVASLGERRSAKDVRNLRTSLFGLKLEHPLLKRPANSIEPAEIADLLRAKVDKGRTASVNRARTALHSAFAYGLKADNDPTRPVGTALFRLKLNPVSAIPKVAKFEVPRDVVIPQAELRAVFAELTHPFARLAVLTLQRIAQLAKATIDGDTLVIVDTKGRNAAAKTNVLPISKAMRTEIAAGALEIPGGERALRAVLSPRGYRTTDLRRTAETFLAERGYSGEDRGRLLSHGLDRATVVRRHYDFSTTLAVKAKMMEAWRRHAIESR